MSFRIGINLGGERPYYGGGYAAQALYMAEVQQAQQAQWQQAAYGQLNGQYANPGGNPAMYGNPQAAYLQRQQQQQERYAASELAVGGNPNDISQRLSAEFCNGRDAYATVQRINAEARQEAFRHHLQGPVDSLQVLADGSIGEVNNYTGQTVGRITTFGQNPQNYYAGNFSNPGYPPVNPSSYYANGFGSAGYGAASYYPPNAGGYYMPPQVAMQFGGRGGYRRGGGLSFNVVV